MIIYHHNDRDGRAAAFVVSDHYKRKFEDKSEHIFVEVDYICPLPTDIIEEGDIVYFVDYSFTLDSIWQLEKILKKTEWVHWIDHHTSSLKLEAENVKLADGMPVKQIRGLRADGISGAALTYMYLNEVMFGEIPRYLQLISDYDCWKYKFNPSTTYLKIGMDSVNDSPESEIWQELSGNRGEITATDKFEEMIKIGKTIKGYIDEDFSCYSKNFAYETEIAGLKCIAVNRKANSWIFGKKIKEYPICMVYAFNGEVYSYSIFSEDPAVNCCAIAESYGGGGHKGAAGFANKELLFKKIKDVSWNDSK